MSDRNVAKRPAYTTAIVDARTPGDTARKFIAATWPRPKWFFSYCVDEFLVSNDGRTWWGVPKADLQARVYRFLEQAVDCKGEPVHATPAKVRAVLWALAHEGRDTRSTLFGGECVA